MGDDPRTWRLLRNALDRPASERQAFVDEACGDDADLRARLMRLIARDAADSPVLDGALDALVDQLPTDSDDAHDATGRMVGPYTIVREIGRGGMGVVYLGRRADVGLDVALKVLRGSLAAPEHERRFLEERRLLARLEHPNIARLLDAGIAADGTPWFAMEHVAGEDLVRWCDRKRLTVRARLALFEKVVSAVAYAQRNLVVHRDIKPANIRVTESGEPKLLDFGIAKLLDTDDEDARTRTGLLLLTPEYAAPEQLRGEPVSTAADVYALGAVLYELLTGHRAHGDERSSPLALERIAAGTGRRRPSDAVTPSSEVDRESAEKGAAARSTEPAGLRRQLRGDLDAIVLKAMAPELDRRYATADALAADLVALRRGAPVSAEAPTLLYVTRRFVTRNAAPVGIGAAGVVALVLLTALYTVRLAAERDHARAESVRATQVANFLKDMFDAMDPTDPDGRITTAEDLLDHGLDRISTDLPGQPAVQAELLGLMGDVYVELGRFDQAEAALSEELRLRRDVLQQPHAVRIDTERKVVSTLFYQGRLAAALEQIRSIVERDRAAGEVDPDVVSLQGAIATRAGDLALAESSYREAISIRRATVDTTADIMLTTKNNYGHALMALGRYAEAEAIWRHVFEERVRAGGRDQTQTLTAMTNLARALVRTGRLDEAEALAADAVARRRRAFRPGHPRIGTALRNLGIALLERGEHERAHAALTEADAILRRAYADGHPDHAVALTELGRTYTALGRTDSAASTLERAVSMHERFVGRENHDYADALAALALNDAAAGRHEEAEARLREADGILTRTVGSAHPRRVVVLEGLASLVADRDPDRARRLRAEAGSIRAVTLGPGEQ